MSPEIRIKVKLPFVKRSLFEMLLTLVVAIVGLFLYLQLPAGEANAFESEYAQLETTGQLLYADKALTSADFEKVVVKSITDGDTIKVTRADGTELIIRYIGIDTPEIQHQNRGTDEPYGALATKLNSWLVLDKTVYLQRDAEETDRYGRSLRYVYTESRVMVNYAMIRLGYASILTIPPNVAFQQQFFAAQELARKEGLNLFQPE